MTEHQLSAFNHDDCICSVANYFDLHYHCGLVCLLDQKLYSLFPSTASFSSSQSLFSGNKIVALTNRMERLKPSMGCSLADVLSPCTYQWWRLFLADFCWHDYACGSLIFFLYSANMDRISLVFIMQCRVDNCCTC